MLDLAPDVDVEAARSRYRKLAREHHPDSASSADKGAATRLMAELNWAMEELERNPERWRSRIGSPVETHCAPDAQRRPVSVSPTLALLNQDNGWVAYVTAAAPDIDEPAIRLRYASDVIQVDRMPSSGGVANFRISLAQGIYEVAAPLRERVEVRARGCRPVEVSVAVEAFIMTERREANQAHASINPRIEIAVWSAALAGAAALVLYLV